MVAVHQDVLIRLNNNIEIFHIHLSDAPGDLIDQSKMDRGREVGTMHSIKA